MVYGLPGTTIWRLSTQITQGQATNFGHIHKAGGQDLKVQYTNINTLPSDNT